MTMATRRVLAFVRDHSGPFSTSGLAAALGLSTRTVERAHALLKRLGIATVWQRMTSRGRHATWSYDLDAVPAEAWSHPDTGAPIPGGPKGVSGWLKPVGGRCAKGARKAAAPRFTRGGAAAWALAKVRRKRPKVAGSPTRERPGVVTTLGDSVAAVAQGEVEVTQPHSSSGPPLPPPDDARTLGNAKRRTAAYLAGNMADFGALPDEQRIADAYLAELAARRQYLAGQHLAHFKRLVRCWLVEHDALLVAMALQSILDKPNLAAYHTNVIETYGWNYVLDKVRDPDSEALGLRKQAA